MILIRATSENADFQLLVKQLDAFLADVNGDDHSFYNQFNGISVLKHVVVAYLNNVPVGCGAFKPVDTDRVEIKRMYVDPAQRGKGVASHVLAELEMWSHELGYQACVLETSIKLVSANQLYAKRGYGRIPNYEPYVDMPDSVCFQKILTA